MTGCEEGFVEFVESNEQVVFGNGEVLKVKKIGTWKGTILNPDGTSQGIVLKNTKYVP